MAKNKLIAPFVKWVGGKRQLMPELTKRLPKAYNNYYEPFIGGGALFFHLQRKRAVINDSNDELINVYNTIKENVEDLIVSLNQHKNEPDYFYTLRAIDRTDKFQELSNIEKASRIIFLNKTCFNGLYRVNNQGEFNSPFGNYKNPNIVNEITLRAVSRYLNENDIEILKGDYTHAVVTSERNDFVYFDPPYHPASETSNFTGYVRGGFNEQAQGNLKTICDQLDQRGVKFLLSNSATEFIRNLYHGYNIQIVKANRAINSVGDKRGEVDEVLISNYE